jgi:hypothetical protein
MKKFREKKYKKKKKVEKLRKNLEKCSSRALQ